MSAITEALLPCIQVSVQAGLTSPPGIFMRWADSQGQNYSDVRCRTVLQGISQMKTSSALAGTSSCNRLSLIVVTIIV